MASDPATSEAPPDSLVTMDEISDIAEVVFSDLLRTKGHGTQVAYLSVLGRDPKPELLRRLNDHAPPVVKAGGWGYHDQMPNYRITSLKAEAVDRALVKWAIQGSGNMSGQGGEYVVEWIGNAWVATRTGSAWFH